MDIVRLAGLSLAVAALSGSAWGQNSANVILGPDFPKPTYEEARAAVTDGDCERTNSDRYVRFYCEDAQALWYFTREGRPEHAGYFVTPALPLSQSPFVFVPADMLRARVAGTWGKSSTPDQRAFSAWSREIRKVAEADAAEIASRPRKRDRGKLYPLEPS